MLTSSSDYWTGIRDGLTSLALDFGRAKLLDVERDNDDRNIPDQADLRYGMTGQGYVSAPGGIPLTGWLVVGLGVVAGALLLRAALR